MASATFQLTSCEALATMNTCSPSIVLTSSLKVTAMVVGVAHTVVVLLTDTDVAEALSVVR